MATNTYDIANRALIKLGEEGNLTSLSTSGTTKGERVMATLYGDIRDAVLRMFPWGFAKRRATLSVAADAPVWGYTGAFLLPSDCLRVLEVDGFDESDSWRIEGLAVTSTTTSAVTMTPSIMLVGTADIDVVYIAQITDVTKFDQWFIEAFSAWLAHEACEAITQSNTKKESLRADLEEAIHQARRASGREQSSTDLADSSWVTVRA
jgi:hypothetical protein